MASSVAKDEQVTDQGEACTAKTCVNVGTLERVASAAIGGALAARGLSRISSLSGALMAVAGGALIFRGVSGFCGTYHLLGMSTADSKPVDGDNVAAAPLDMASRSPDEIEEASDESFPASDPPAWTTSSATRNNVHR